MAKLDITAEYLRELFDYCHDTGQFTRKIRTSNRVAAGDIAGHPDKDGYLQIYISGGQHKCHRLVWLFVFGAWPSKHIDHINGIRHDNRFCNLREATMSENMQNQRPNSSNTSGFMGVVKASHTTCKWQAQIKACGKNHFLGLFDTPEKAHAAYVAAKRRIHTFNPEANG